MIHAEAATVFKLWPNTWVLACDVDGRRNHGHSTAANPWAILLNSAVMWAPASYSRVVFYKYKLYNHKFFYIIQLRWVTHTLSLESVKAIPASNIFSFCFVWPCEQFAPQLFLFPISLFWKTLSKKENAICYKAEPCRIPVFVCLHRHFIRSLIREGQSVILSKTYFLKIAPFYSGYLCEVMAHENCLWAKNERKIYVFNW